MFKGLWDRLKGKNPHETEGKDTVSGQQAVTEAMDGLAKADRKQVFRMLRNPQVRQQAVRLMQMMTKDGVNVKDEAAVKAWIEKNKEALQKAEKAEPQAQEKAVPIVRESPKVGRNDPCGCGSDKKSKKCCAVAKD